MCFYISLIYLGLILLVRGVGGKRIIEVGNDPNKFNVGWMEGVCYLPIEHVQPGDVIAFKYRANHDVRLLSSLEHFLSCNFSESVLVAGMMESPYEYVIEEEDVGKVLYFACGVGSHCGTGRQKVLVNVTNATNAVTAAAPVSAFVSNVQPSTCNDLHQGAPVPSSAQASLTSTCSEPTLDSNGTYHVTCLSPPATLTPGGVMNEFRILHYPYPLDRRVLLGLRTWEFVQGDPAPDGLSGVTPVYLNQLYIHHLTGGVTLGQGAEGIRQTDPDAPFDPPFGLLTGNEGDVSVFHIIDLREVGDEWLECVECRCRHDNGTFLTTPNTADGQTGGILCCTNCTNLLTPTVDYRMRYNVSYTNITLEQPVQEVDMMTADIAPALGKNIEFDVPSFSFLPKDQQDPWNPQIQRLVREGPFSTLFKKGFLSPHYDGPEQVSILRCVGHLHIAGIQMYLQNAETEEILCKSVGTHGTNPSQNKGFLTSISVENFPHTENVIAHDTPVRLVTEYNASTLHTGVMGLWFVFVAGDTQITSAEADLVVDVCTLPTCQMSSTLLPELPTTLEIMQQRQECEDALPTSPTCQFLDICDCEELVNHEDSTGCGGVFTVERGEASFVVSVDSMCRKYCGCPPLVAPVEGPPQIEQGGEGGEEGTASNAISASSLENCEDTLNQHAACHVGGICTCPELVAHNNLTFGTGCDGFYTSDEVGDVVVQEVCRSHCQACENDVGMTVDEEKKRGWLERMKNLIKSKCVYATEECRLLLSNLYTCAKSAEEQEEGGAGMEVEGELDPLVKDILKENGRNMALDHAKLAHESLHRFGPSREEMEAAVKPCEISVGEEYQEEEGDETEADAESEVELPVSTVRQSNSSSARTSGWYNPWAIAVSMVALACTMLF